MANKKFWAGILVMVLVFGLVSVGTVFAQTRTRSFMGVTITRNGTHDFVAHNTNGRDVSVFVSGTTSMGTAGGSVNVPANSSANFQMALGLPSGVSDFWIRAINFWDGRGNLYP